MSELIDPAGLGTTPGLPDDCFEHDGLITKRQQRASAFAFLRPGPGQLLWDVGTGSGAVAIEWCRAAPEAHAVAVERRAERAERAQRNIDRLAPGRVQLHFGMAAELIATLPTPDAIFIGGGLSAEVLDGCRAALRAGGRLVAHGVTLETEALLADRFAAHGGQLTRISVETAEPLGRFTGWVPARPVTQWAFVLR